MDWIKKEDRLPTKSDGTETKQNQVLVLYEGGGLSVMKTNHLKTALYWTHWAKIEMPKEGITPVTISS